MASHEFRTPLSVILSSVSLVAKYTEPEQEEKRKKHLDRIKSLVKNLTEILEDFLSLDKLEQGKVDRLIEHFDISKLAKDTKAMVDGMLKKGQWVNCIHKGEKQIISDRRIIGNILANLLSNAIKYSPEGSAIELITQMEANEIAIIVSDNGIGIPDEDQKDIFKMFHRAKNVNSIQGTGLGLNIVKRYAGLLGGVVTFRSKINEGTTFTVTFTNAIK